METGLKKKMVLTFLISLALGLFLPYSLVLSSRAYVFQLLVILQWSAS